MLKLELAILFLSGAAILSAGSASELYLKSQNNTDAVQQWYTEGVPHTDRNGRLRMTYDPDKSFFPIGMWGVPGDTPGGEYDWRKLKELKINTVWPWMPGAWWREPLVCAGKHGLQVIVMREIPADILSEIVDHPRLLANNWEDEPSPVDRVAEKVNRFLDYKQRVKKTAPGLPVFVNNSPWIMPPATQGFLRWDAVSDVLSQDNYPVKISAANTSSIGSQPNGIPQTLTISALGAEQKKPLWMIIGAFGQAQKRPGAQDRFPYRFPTPDQLRSCVYTSLIHGATGIHYFIWDSAVARAGNVLGISPEPCERPTGCKETDHPASPSDRVQMKALWEAVKSVNSELEVLAPALLSPTVSPEQTTYSIESSRINGTSVNRNPVRGLLKKHPATGELILLSSNIDAVSLDTCFRFDRKIKSVEIMFDSYPYPVTLEKDQYSFKLRYEPFASHVLKIHLDDSSKRIVPEISKSPAAAIVLSTETARLWAPSAKRIDDPYAPGAKAVEQLCKDKTGAWAIQWNDPVFLNAQPGAVYEIYLHIRVEGGDKKGPLLNFGWWNPAQKKHLFQAAVDQDQISNKSIPVELRLGRVSFPVNAHETLLYLAPDPKCSATAYYISSLEMRKVPL